MRSKEQRLIDIVFQIAFCAARSMHGKSNEEIAAWVTQQLSICGFNTAPCGASWGVLEDNSMKEKE